MPTNDDSEDGRAHLEQINSELNRSLERCRDLLKRHRWRLADNSNERRPDETDEEERTG